MDWWVFEGFVRPIGYAVWVVMVGLWSWVDWSGWSVA